MATINDIVLLEVQDEQGPVITDFNALRIDVSAPLPLDLVELQVPGAVEFVESLVVGPQGPPGVNNLWVGPTGPSDPFLNQVWVRTS